MNMNMNDIQSIFFDFDGVILDSTAIKTDTFKDIFSPYGENIVKQVIHHHQINGGISRVEKIAYYYETFLNQPLTQSELDSKCTDFSSRVKDKVIKADWIPGAWEFLEKHHREVPLYVVSGTPEDELYEIIEKRGMLHYFKRVFGSPVKKPVHVKNVMSDLDLDPNACFFIGDALTDYRTAEECSIHFIGIQGAIDFPEETIVLPNCFELEQTILSL